MAFNKSNLSQNTANKLNEKLKLCLKLEAQNEVLIKQQQSLKTELDTLDCKRLQHYQTSNSVYNKT